MNADYNEDVLAQWNASGCLVDMGNRLGYRYSLVNATLPTSAVGGGVATFNLTVLSSGFAAAFSARPVHLVAQMGSTTCTAVLPTRVADPRFWLPVNGNVSGATYVIDAAVQLPAATSMPAGSYALFLHMPDRNLSLSSRPEYAIQLANTAMFSATTGRNALNAAMTVTSGPACPGCPYDAVFHCGPGSNITSLVVSTATLPSSASGGSGSAACSDDAGGECGASTGASTNSATVTRVTITMVLPVFVIFTVLPTGLLC